MIPLPLSVSDIAVDLDGLLSSLIERGSSPTEVRAVKKAGKRLLRLGGHDALFAAAQLIAARNCASSTRNLRIDLLQEAWGGIERCNARSRSLNAWRQRKKKDALLVQVEVSKATRHKLVALGWLQIHELHNKVEIARAVTDLLEDLVQNS